jgi:hypothetical protein
VGRPRTLTPESEPILFSLISSGLTIAASCRAAKIHYPSVTKMAFNDEPFRNRLARARIAGAVFVLDRAEHGLVTSTPRRIAIDREIALHARWVAAALLPAFSKRLEISAPRPPHPTEAEQISQLEGARRMAFVLARGAHLAEQQRKPREPVLIEHVPEGKP